MIIVQLNTGLFPDAQTVSAALRQTTQTHLVDVIDLRRPEMKDSDWEAAIRAILAADRVVSV